LQGYTVWRFGSYDYTDTGITPFGSGVVAISGIGAYLNGTKILTISTSAFTSTDTLLLLRMADNTFPRYLDGTEQAIVAYSVTLTDNQVSLVSTAMAGL